MYSGSATSDNDDVFIDESASSKWTSTNNISQES